MMKHLIAAGIVVAVLLLFSSFFTVREDQYAVLFRLGEITRSDFKPGLHINYAETVLPMKDGLPKFKDFPGAFGGSDEQVPE